MERLTTDTPNGNFETMLNFVYGKDGWAYIRHDGAHEDIMLTDWAKQQCLLRGCNEVEEDGPEDIDQRLCDCMMEGPTCPIAMAYCFASQAVHLRSRLKMYEDTIPFERAQELAQAEKDRRLMVLPCKVGSTVYTITSPANVDGIENEEAVDIFECIVESVTFYLNGNAQFRLYYHGIFVASFVTVNDFGKTVFPTREEAEAALKKKEADNEAD